MGIISNLAEENISERPAIAAGVELLFRQPSPSKQ